MQSTEDGEIAEDGEIMSRDLKRARSEVDSRVDSRQSYGRPQHQSHPQLPPRQQQHHHHRQHQQPHQQHQQPPHQQHHQQHQHQHQQQHEYNPRNDYSRQTDPTQHERYVDGRPSVPLTGGPPNGPGGANGHDGPPSRYGSDLHPNRDHRREGETSNSDRYDRRYENVSRNQAPPPPPPLPSHFERQRTHDFNQQNHTSGASGYSSGARGSADDFHRGDRQPPAPSAPPPVLYQREASNNGHHSRSNSRPPSRQNSSIEQHGGRSLSSSSSSASSVADNSAAAPDVQPPPPLPLPVAAPLPPRPPTPREKTGFEHRCDLAYLGLKSDMQSLRSENLLARVESLTEMIFEVNENGIIENVGFSHPEPPPFETTKAGQMVLESVAPVS